jgi:hypothetical protein
MCTHHSKPNAIQVCILVPPMLPMKLKTMLHKLYVATLVLGLRPRQKGLQGCGSRGSLGAKAKEAVRVQTKREPGSHITYSRECEEVWGSVTEWTLTLPRQLPLWEMESRWTLETSESDFRGQNSMACDVLYIIGKILELRCLKWARIPHLGIWNTSYGQKKLWPLKVGNRPLSDIRFESATRRWKDLNKGYNFGSNLVAIGLWSRELWAPKVLGL